MCVWCHKICPFHSKAPLVRSVNFVSTSCLDTFDAVYTLAGIEFLRGPFEPVARLLGAPAGTPDAIIHWG